MVSKAEILKLIQSLLIEYNNSILNNIYVNKNNILEKNNKEYYTPKDDYNPATKIYVDEAMSKIIADNVDLNLKADKTYVDSELAKKLNIEGHVLTDNNYTSIEKNKLADIEANANNYIHPSIHEASIIKQDSSHRFVTDDEKSVWNSKSDKNHTHIEYLTEVPPEYITEAELDSKNYLTEHQDISTLASQTYVNNKVAQIVNSAPETLDTLNELAAALGNDPNFATTVANQIGTKASNEYVKEELAKKVNIEGYVATDNNYTTIEKNKLASIENNANNYTHPINHEATVITEDSTHRFVTDTEKNIWNSKSDFSFEESTETNINIDESLSRHTHNNKSVLDSITEEKVISWNNKASINDDLISLDTVWSSKKIDAQFNTKASISYVNEKINKIASGTPKGTYADLNALKIAKPNGDTGIYITLDNGNWNYWNNETWIPGGVYQSQILGTNIITDKNISKESNIVIKKSKNKIDTGKCTNGYYVDYKTGKINVLEGYSVSEFIYLDNDITDLTLSLFTDATKKPLEQLAFYDFNENYISGLSNTGASESVSFKKPDGACYIRLTLRNIYIDNYQLEVGTVMTEFKKYNATIDISSLPIEDIKDEIIEYKINKIIVNQKGAGDFASLRDALESINDANENNIYDVYIHEGTYNVMSYYTDEEINNNSFIGLQKPPFVNLIGMGNVILKGELSSTYSDETKLRVSTLVTKGSGILENLTVTSKNLRYSVHDDYNYTDLERKCINCNFIKKAGYGHVQAYGGGVYSNHNVYFENCYFSSEMGIAFSYHNNKNFTSKSKIKMVGCECVTTKEGQSAMRFGSMGSGQQDEIQLIGCTTNKIQVKEEQDNGVGIDFTLKGYANDIFDIEVTGNTSKIITNTNGFIKTV